MANDPVLIAETRSWFVKAAEDIGAGSLDLEAPTPFTADAVFHAQQAVEKTLKAFLTWHGQAFRKTHNLEEVGEQCLRIDGTLRDLIDRAAPLTEYAWKYRYPGEQARPTKAEAAESLAIAEEAYESVLVRLPKDVRP